MKPVARLEEDNNAGAELLQLACAEAVRFLQQVEEHPVNSARCQGPAAPLPAQGIRPWICLARP